MTVTDPQDGVVHDASFAAFLAQVQQVTNLTDWPLADAVKENVLVYQGEAVRAACREPERRRALLAEWARLFMDGPGVVVIANAYEDTAPLDTATALFEDMIAEQHRASKAAQADHFAKAGANDRVWNALEKHGLRDPENFADYFGNEAIALVCESWLGPGYQVTAQVNRVNPGGEAQSAHRDYHLGFMTPEQMSAFPSHIHALSPVLTLQGAIAHCDMPLETGPTLYLPYSQQFTDGYLLFSGEQYQGYFNEHRRQLALSKGDAVFFNPAVMHAAGANRTADRYRLANLLQVSSAMGRAMEWVDRHTLCEKLYKVLLKRKRAGQLDAGTEAAVIAATAEGYSFPTSLDHNPPVGGLAPVTQAELFARALVEDLDETEFLAKLSAHTVRQHRAIASDPAI